jgi:hypothetical protein
VNGNFTTAISAITGTDAAQALPVIARSECDEAISARVRVNSRIAIAASFIMTMARDAIQ